ncbi:MAG: hydrogenase maturation protease, partial [Planctomycetota bacterium]
MGVSGIRVANRRKLILGIGNSLRGDDGVGERVVRALENLGVASDTCRLMISHQWIPELVLAFSDFDRLIVIDASVAHLPGEIRLQRVGSRVKGSK